MGAMSPAPASQPKGVISSALRLIGTLRHERLDHVIVFNGWRGRPFALAAVVFASSAAFASGTTVRVDATALRAKAQVAMLPEYIPSAGVKRKDMRHSRC